MKLHGIVVVVLMTLSGCTGLLGIEDDGGTGAGNGGGAGQQANGGGSGGGSAAGDLPCDVASVLGDACLSCHGSGGSQVKLQSRADLVAMSAAFPTMSHGQRAVVRMRASAGTMPPAPSSPVANARINAFEAWVNAGMSAGSCQAASDAGTADAGAVTPYDGGIAGLPCDVAAFVASKCATCHGSPPTQGTSFSLLSRADFLAPSPTFAGVTIGARSSIRVHAASNPMPPLGVPAPTAAELSAFDGWLSTGMPTGTCGAIDAGVAGPAPTTCVTGSYWNLGNTESANMNPGLACLACHRNQAPDKAYPFSGTIFPSLHEKDRCNSRPAGVQVQIIDVNGNVALTLNPSTTSGNFHSSLYANVALPYTARVTAGGRTATMTTPQTNGDCNSCHTEQGTSGALGRIVAP